MFEGNEPQLTTPRTLHTKEGREAAIAQAKADFIANGREDGTAVAEDEETKHTEKVSIQQELI